MAKSAHQNWAKMSADLDSNPKVRRAGRLGREVFLFALRRNSAREGTGMIPSSDMEAWYLADQLMMTETEASDGLSRAIAAGLIERIDGEFGIAGWDDEWAKRPMTAAERQALKRARVTSHEAVVTFRDGGSQNTHPSNAEDLARHEAIVTPRDCHASEERRGEETRGSSRARSASDVADVADVAPTDPSPQELPGSGSLRTKTELGMVPPRGVEVPDPWRLLAAEVWQVGGTSYRELVVEGVDATANVAAWNGMPAKCVGERLRDLRDRGFSVDDARAAALNAIASAVATARVKRTLRWFVPSRFFEAKSFAISAEQSPTQATTPSGPPPPKVLRRAPPPDDEPNFGPKIPTTNPELTEEDKRIWRERGSAAAAEIKAEKAARRAALEAKA